MTLTIKDAPEILGSSKPGAPAPASEGAAGQSPRSNPVCLEVSVVVRSLPGEDGGTSGPAGPSRQDGRSVIVFDNGAVLRIANPLPPGQKVIVSNHQGTDVVCRVVSGRNLPNVKGYIEVEFMEPVSDFWHIHQTQQPAGGPPPAVPALPVSALQQPTPVAKPPAPSVAPRATASPKEAEKAKDAPFGGAPTFDDVAGLVLMSLAESTSAKKIETPSASVVSKNKIESTLHSAVLPTAVLPKPAASYSKTSSVSDLDYPGISAPSTPSAASTMEAIAETPAKEFFSGDVLGRTTPEESRGRMPMVLGVAALLVAGLGAGYYFTHQSNSPANSSAPAQPMAAASQATSTDTAKPTGSPTSQSTGTQQTSISKPVVEQAPAQAAEPVVVASAKVTNPAPLDTENVRLRTNSAEPKQPDLASARRPVVIPNLKMRSPSASSKALAKLPDGSAAESLDIAATVAPGAGTPGTFSARKDNQPAPPPGLVAPAAASTVVIPAKLISSTRPVYPPTAKNLNIQGNVVVTATINEKGLVTVAKAVSGPIALRQAGVDAVMGWKYSPALTGGKPSPTEITVTIEFHLK